MGVRKKSYKQPFDINDRGYENLQYKRRFKKMDKAFDRNDQKTVKQQAFKMHMQEGKYKAKNAVKTVGLHQAMRMASKMHGVKYKSANEKEFIKDFTKNYVMQQMNNDYGQSDDYEREYLIKTKQY